MKFGDKLGTNGGRNRPQRLARPCRRSPYFLARRPGGGVTELRTHERELAGV